MDSVSPYLDPVNVSVY